MKRPRKKPSTSASRRASELAEIDAFIAKNGVTHCPAYQESDQIQLEERRAFYAAKSSWPLRRAATQANAG